MRFNPPQNWPQAPVGWTPLPGSSPAFVATVVTSLVFATCVAGCSSGGITSSHLITASSNGAAGNGGNEGDDYPSGTSSGTSSGQPASTVVVDGVNLAALAGPASCQDPAGNGALMLHSGSGPSVDTSEFFSVTLTNGSPRTVSMVMIKSDSAGVQASTGVREDADSTDVTQDGNTYHVTGTFFGFGPDTSSSAGQRLGADEKKLTFEVKAICP